MNHFSVPAWIWMEIMVVILSTGLCCSFCCGKYWKKKEKQRNENNLETAEKIHGFNGIVGTLAKKDHAGKQLTAIQIKDEN